MTAKNNVFRTLSGQQHELEKNLTARIHEVKDFSCQNLRGKEEVTAIIKNNNYLAVKELKWL